MSAPSGAEVIEVVPSVAASAGDCRGVNTLAVAGGAFGFSPRFIACGWTLDD